MAIPTDPTFKLDPRLEQDCLTITDLPLSRILLMDDARYPWLILVPRCANITEIFELSEAQQQQLMAESSALSKAMTTHFQPRKMNVANLGNIVSQLHLHFIARFEDDPAWPGAVWGHSPAIPYSEPALVERHNTLNSILVEVQRQLGKAGNS